jgi:hypothetical protein
MFMVGSVRVVAGLAVAGLFGVAACTGSGDKKSSGSSGSSGPPSASISVGPTGGTIQAGGARLTVPAGALSAPVTLTVAVDTASQVPTGVTGQSVVYRFGPAGTTFAVPATVAISVLPNVSSSVVYWSDGDSPTFAPLPGSSVQSGTVTAAITHFSRGFAGAPPPDAGVPVTDAGAPDAAVLECSSPRPAEPCARGVASNGQPTCECPDRCGGKVYRLKCDGTQCECLVDSVSTQTFDQGATCRTGITAALRFCQGLGDLPDAGHTVDAGRTVDAGVDAGTTPTDAGRRDAANLSDAAVPPDAAGAPDAAPSDAG